MKYELQNEPIGETSIYKKILSAMELLSKAETSFKGLIELDMNDEGYIILEAETNTQAHKKLERLLDNYKIQHINYE